jgi:Porin subfamily
MKKLFPSAVLLAGFLSIAPAGHAQDSVEYVKVCSTYSAAMHYIPGTDICVNDETGQTMEQGANLQTWTALLPTNSQGHWVTLPQLDCTGQLVQVGTFKPSDFKLNAFGKYQAPPFAFKLQAGQFISGVMMSGGFYDPLQPIANSPQLSPEEFCLRAADPAYFTIDMGAAPVYPPFCNPVPLGCVSNSQILGTPATYSFSALGAPVIHYNTDINGKVIGSPMTCGSQLVVTTGMGKYDPTTVSDPSKNAPIPAAGTLSVWACVQPAFGFGFPLASAKP